MGAPKLLVALWPVLLIGRIFVGLPVAFEPASRQLRCSFSPFTLLHSLINWSSFTVITIFAIIICTRQIAVLSDLNSVQQLFDLCYHVHITLTSTFCIWQSRKFQLIFQAWDGVDTCLKKYEK